MKRLGYSAVIAGLAWAAACASDPTSVLRNGLKSLTVDPDVMFINEGDGRGLNVIPRDEQLNPVAAAVTVASSDDNIATVDEDPGQPSTDGSNHRYNITAVAPGQAKIAVTAGGVSDTAVINVMPLAFAGTPSGTSLQVGGVLSLAATASLKFDTATSNVNFGDSTTADVISATAETLIVRVPQPNSAAPSKLTVQNVAITYVTGLHADLPTVATFTVTNPFGSHSTPDPAATINIPANGGPDLVFYDGFGSAEVDHYYTFTTAATDTITFQLDWSSGADIDMYVCDAGCNTFEGGANKFDAATGANPEIVTMILPAGSHNLYINVFDTLDTPAYVYKVTITNP